MADNIFGSTALTSQDFDGTWHTFGALAEVSEDCNLVGGRAFFPNPEPANFTWVVFRVSDEAIVAECDLTALASPTLGAWNDFTSADFEVPGDVALDSAEQYIPAVVTNGDFRFKDSGVSYPYGAGIVTASEGRFHNGGAGPVFPTSTSSSVVFGADMLVEADGGGPVAVVGTAVGIATSTAGVRKVGQAASTASAVGLVTVAAGKRATVTGLVSAAGGSLVTAAKVGNVAGAVAAAPGASAQIRKVAVVSGRCTALALVGIAAQVENPAPGAHSAGGTSAELTASATTAAVLSPSGSAATLAASGLP